MRDRVFFGLFAAFFFAISLLGGGIDFRWRNRATGPMMPNWLARLLFAFFGVAFLFAAISSK